MLNVSKQDYSTFIDGVTVATFPGVTSRHLLVWSVGELPAHSREEFNSDEALVTRMLEIAPANAWQIIQPED